MICEIARSLPKREEYNLGSQIVRAATSVCLNIAEGSTGQSDAENSRFVGMAIRSLVEVVACIRLIERRNYLNDKSRIKAENANDQAHDLFAMLQAYRAKLTPQKPWTRE
jgi:four helix bundle protein